MTERVHRYPGRSHRILDADISDVPEACTAPTPETLTLRDMLEDVLLDGLHPIDTLGRTVDALQAIVDDQANQRAADAVRELLHRVRGAPGEALRRACLGSPSESIRAAGKRVHRSHVALLKAQRRIRLRLPQGA